MIFDPSKPASGTQMLASEVRNNLNALNDVITAQAAQIASLTTQLAAVQAQLATRAPRVDGVALFDTNIPYHTPIEPGGFRPHLQQGQ